MKIYLAGPLFTPGERWQNTQIATGLRALGHEVFVPQEQEQREATPANIFKSDVKGVEWSDIVVACMDNADPDSGTSWECGFAYGLGKPCIVYRSDIRIEGPPFGPFNLMLTQSAHGVVDGSWKDCADIVSDIQDCIDAL